MAIDYSDEPGWPAKSTVVRRIPGRERRTTNWRARLRKPLWYRALLSRGSLR